MADTLKPAGANCPTCHAERPGEFKRMAEAFTRWACLCGASGVISGSVPAPAPVAPKPLPHWSVKARA